MFSETFKKSDVFIDLYYFHQNVQQKLDLLKIYSVWVWMLLQAIVP